MVILTHKDNEEIKMDDICESEKKRLESLKHKKQVYRAKELAVQNALKNLDINSSKNKIIFDENIDEVEQPKIKEKKVKKRKRDLFDNDDDDDDDKYNNELIWDDNKFDINKNASRKFPGQTFTLGTDERFKLDERFMEDDAADSNENVTEQNKDESDLQKEKELQLNILENILGEPIISKNKSTNKELKVAKKEMIRYDPTKNNHKEYEVNTEKPEVNNKKVKKKKTKDSTEDTVENPPVNVSKDIYFSVSESLSKSLKEGGQFSLLKTHENVENSEKANDYNLSTVELPQPPKFQYNFNSKNPFKYDSSDDDNEHEHDTKEEYTNNEQHTNDVSRDTHKFFFDTNDPRFNEAIQFFAKERMPDDTFKDLRRELKQIMRSKIQRNVKKNQPWGRKKSIKRLS